MSTYPAPRYPRLRKPKSIDELMPRARELLNKPPSHFHALKPSYGIKAGDKILFVALSEYEPMVIEAMCRAMREKGAHVDLLVLDSSPLAPPEDLAAHEAIAIDKEEDDYSYYYSKICDIVRRSTAKALVDSEKYSMVIAGSAGPLPSPISFPWHRFNLYSLEDFASPTMDYPSDLQRMIDEKTHAQVMSARSLRITDPEGTDVRWTNYEDGRPLFPNHIFARPVNIGHGFGGKDDCAGVVAGTLNHMGAFPYCKAYIEGGQVVRIEGGGKYGEVWREKLEKYRKVMWPPFPTRYGGPPENRVPAPGMFWFYECGIGTTAGAFRLPQEGLFQCYANFLHDRMRSGYIHCGFGLSVMGQRQAIEAGLPWVHTHIHLVFPTLEGTTRSGQPITIIDKGHLTTLDDPEVRSLAGKYGNPDELLTEAWFPAIPGINAPGDYMKDYARSPISWIKREAKEHPIWMD